MPPGTMATKKGHGKKGMGFYTQKKLKYTERGTNWLRICMYTCQSLDIYLSTYLCGRTNNKLDKLDLKIDKGLPILVLVVIDSISK